MMELLLASQERTEAQSAASQEREDANLKELRKDMKGNQTQSEACQEKMEP
jgi:predicted  nucleic acid-binding Zn-ribbon protein